MRHVPALLACASVAAVFAVLAFYHPQPAYTLLAFDDQGDAWALDTGLTLDDCRSDARALPDIYEAAYCEPEA